MRRRRVLVTAVLVLASCIASAAHAMSATKLCATRSMTPDERAFLEIFGFEDSSLAPKGRASFLGDQCYANSPCILACDAAIDATIKWVRCSAGAACRYEDLTVDVVYRLRPRIGEPEQQAVSHTSLETSLKRMVDRVTTIGPQYHRSAIRMRPNAIDAGSRSGGPRRAEGLVEPRAHEVVDRAILQAGVEQRCHPTRIAAAHHLGRDFRGRDVVIIGDSIYDIRCGVPYDATTIAVASGKTPPERLRAENPRHFFESAEDLGAMMDAILG